jgi:hypothetical protein
MNYIVRKVLEPRYEVVRADEMPRPGVITSQVIELLNSADLVLTDPHRGECERVLRAGDPARQGEAVGPANRS